VRKAWGTKKPSLQALAAEKGERQGGYPGVSKEKRGGAGHGGSAKEKRGRSHKERGTFSSIVRLWENPCGKKKGEYINRLHKRGERELEK